MTDRKPTFEQQQELNRVRDSAMRAACEGLTTTELNKLNPNLLRAAPNLKEACRHAIIVLENLKTANLGELTLQQELLLVEVQSALSKAKSK